MAERSGAPRPGRTGERGHHGAGLGWTGRSRDGAGTDRGWTGRTAQLGTARLRQETGAGGSAFPPCGAAAARGADPGPGRYVNGAAEGGGCAGAERERSGSHNRSRSQSRSRVPGAPHRSFRGCAPLRSLYLIACAPAEQPGQTAGWALLVYKGRHGLGLGFFGGLSGFLVSPGGVWGLGVVWGNGARFCSRDTRVSAGWWWVSCGFKAWFSQFFSAFSQGNRLGAKGKEQGQLLCPTMGDKWLCPSGPEQGVPSPEQG